MLFQGLFHICWGGEGKGRVGTRPKLCKGYCTALWLLECTDAQLFIIILKEQMYKQLLCKNYIYFFCEKMLFFSYLSLIPISQVFTHANKQFHQTLEKAVS